MHPLEVVEDSSLLFCGPYGEILKLRVENAKEFRDDLTGQLLDPQLVREARATEMEYVRSKGLWAKRPVKECLDKTGRPPVTVRWVDTNKGDDKCPNIRSRLVARQIRGPGQEAVFAPTPPLEALRTVLSLAATDLPGRPRRCRDPKSESRVQVSFVDISRAYFNAKTNPDEPTYVQLPEEDADAGRGLCGLLLKHMYGTQKAAEGWQSEYSSSLVEKLGFTQGLACPCIFVHESRDIVCTVHGDDFTAVGPKSSLDWYEAELKKLYELKTGGRLGPGKDDDKEATCLNRVIRWTDDGLEYEADPRQAEKLVEELELDGDGVKSTATPGIKALPTQIAEDQVLDPSRHTLFRGLAARANYLAADRPDCQFAAKEICRWMSSPTDGALQALKRLCRYLVGRPRLVFRYPFQSADSIDCYSDTDWAGCARTRKSTSGGVIVLGSHILKTWSSTQPTISLSSGEAEFYGVVRASGAALGQQSLFRDLGVELQVCVWTDSTAAVGISTRQGLGKLRHIDTHTLWIQERVRNKSLKLRKVRGDCNPADLLTKHMPSREKLTQLVQLFGCAFIDGRAVSAPLLRKRKPEELVGRGFADDVVEVVEDSDLHGKILMVEAKAHDVDRWPHLYPAEELEVMFPLVIAAADVEAPTAEEMGEHKALHERWATRRPVG